MGMIPDLATIRDRATTKFRRLFYGIFAMGWRNATNHWRNFELAYLLLAGLSTPLVLSVHTIVSFDFAVAQLPGWHTTIFPPYFVAGAIFSGFGMVLTLMLPLRAVYKMHDLITQVHIDNMCKITLATGTMVGYAYSMEFFIAWYGANPFESFAFINRAFGQYWWAYLTMISCNVISPQLFWFRKIRENPAAVWIISIFVNGHVVWPLLLLVPPWPMISSPLAGAITPHRLLIFSHISEPSVYFLYSFFFSSAFCR